MSVRQASRKRATRETSIEVQLVVDGRGQADVDTGLPFFDHMLDQLGRHGGFDLTVHAQGDLAVDSHHTVEDVAITLGETLREALGDKAGVRRFASGLYPLDEPELPARTHVRRALGGPVMSLIVTIVAVVIAWLMRSAGSPYTWIAVFTVLDNFLIFTLGAFLPLGFTDGSTLLRLWRARNASPAA